MADGGKFQSHLSKRERKNAKEEKKRARKKALDDASESLKQQQKWARESRVHLLGILFGYLKSEKRSEPLLPFCLSAISKFSPYLGIEYFSDLICVIKSLICNSHGRISAILALQCVITVLRLSELQENASSMDLKFFFDLFFLLLKQPDQLYPHMKLEKEVFSMLFLSNRILPKDRVASFAHRLCFASESSHEAVRETFAEQLCDLFVHYPSIRPLLDDEPFGNGAFLDNCDDPDICKPFCRKLDLSKLLGDPDCRPFIKKILR
jgi:hypothetical protein